MKNETDEKTRSQQGWFGGKQMNPNALKAIVRKRLITVNTTGLSLHIHGAKRPGTRTVYGTGPPGRAPVKTVVRNEVFKPPEQPPEHSRQMTDDTSVILLKSKLEYKTKRTEYE